MTTSRQVKANRKNAIKGGIKTEVGKAISSQNATKYGFFSKITTEFDKLMKIFANQFITVSCRLMSMKIKWWKSFYLIY